MNIYFGIVENRNDPLTLGRCQVRVVGLHTHDKNLLPTADLPWAATMQPTISAAMNGIGHTPIGPVEGTSVVVTYLDDNMQQGLILGAVGGIATEPVPIDFDDSGPILKSEEIEKTVLRSVPGPTNGNKLKFYDPNSSRSDLTKDLKANMRVSGYGITEGTTIVSIDSGVQITISTEVREFGENIIEFLPPPTNAAAVIESKTLVAPTSIVNKADDVKNTPVNNSIPTIPPPKSTSNQTKATEGIKALLAACDKVGLTTKEQKCSVLAIAGGESGFIPQKEMYSYPPERLKEIFPRVTQADIDKYSYAPSKNMTRQEFFSFFYGPTFRGKGFFGHKTDAEGGLYFGRGFIQLTGKSNYETYQNEAKKYGVTLDLVANPDSLDFDINTSALVAALYIKKRTPSSINPNSSPGYFEAAKNGVGKNTADIAAKKRRFYDYFYGEVSGAGHLKDAGVEIPTPPEVATSINNFQPGPSEKAITSGSFSIGFRDPNNKYPLKDYLNESDVNRLARGVIEGTIIGDKDASRKVGIPKPFDGGEWSQPIASFGAQYPFNKVFESESGHIQEWDDTPGQERVNTYHKAGTYTEIDANGTQVNYIVGDNFILMENNGCIHVAGECNITVDGTTNIFARSDANLKVAGNARVEVGNNADIGVANDVTLAVGGDMDTQVNGAYRLTAAKGIQMVTNGPLGIQSGETTSLKSGGGLYVESKDIFAAKVGGDFAMQAKGIVGLKAGKDLFTTAGGELHIKATKAVKLDGSNFAQQSKLAGSAGNVDGVDSIDALALTIPSAGDPVYASPEYKQPPPRQFEQSHPIETPDDWNSPEGRAVISEKSKTEGVDSPPPVATSDFAKPTGGNGKTVKTDCSIIYTTKNFTNDYRLSRNFTIGMLIKGTQHILQSQMLKPNRNSNERLYPVEEIVCNMAHLAQNVLEPALDVLPNGISGYGKIWHITSGYRLKGVVKHESQSSDHCKGHCIDISLGNGTSLFAKNFELAKNLESILTYDQMLLEYDSPDKSWVHIGYRPDSNRREVFTMVNHVFDASKRGFILLSGSVPPVAKKS